MAEKVLATCIVLFALCPGIAKAFPDVDYPPKKWQYAVVGVYMSSAFIGITDLIYLIWR